jgi:hypothetical protein
MLRPEGREDRLSIRLTPHRVVVALARASHTEVVGVPLRNHVWLSRAEEESTDPEDLFVKLGLDARAQ